MFGDYDVDGSVSTALLADFLAALGSPPRIYIPDRMTRRLWPVRAPRCGRLQGRRRHRWWSRWIAAPPAAPLSKPRGASGWMWWCWTITGSRRAAGRAGACQSQPAGDNRASTYLCAAGVTFLFLVALNRASARQRFLCRTRSRRAGSARASGSGGAGHGLRCGAADGRQPRLCAPGPGADCRSCRGRALRRWRRWPRRAPPFTAYHLGFVFGPRINAGGRVGRSSLGVDLLTAREAAGGGGIRRPARSAQSRAPGRSRS